MNIKVMLVFLGISGCVFLHAEESMAANQHYVDTTWGHFHGNNIVRAPSIYSYSPAFERKQPPVATPVASAAVIPATSATDIDIASRAVAIACTDAKQPFFGFDPRDPHAMNRLDRGIDSLRSINHTSKLLKDWVNQPNKAVKLAGFLNSFGTTLALAKQPLVERHMVHDREAQRHSLLEKAYDDMTRLISGQVVELDKKRTATKAEAHVLLQAAASLGQRFAAAFSPVFDLYNRHEALQYTVDYFYSRYNFQQIHKRDTTKWLHNTILLKQSVSEALKSRRIVGDIDSLLLPKGFDKTILAKADVYLHTINDPIPNSYFKEIIEDAQTTYDSGIASRELAGIELLGLDRKMVHEKFAPYKQRGFDILRNSDAFIKKLREEFKAKSSPSESLVWIASLLDSIEYALNNPKNIDTMPGFGLGSIIDADKTKIKEEHKKESEKESDKKREERKKVEAKHTWLNAIHEFVEIFCYAEKNGLLFEFYTEPTPVEDGPCLPGKIRCFQEWSEIKKGSASGADTIVERVFAGYSGIEMSNAIKMLYSKVFDNYACEYCLDEQINVNLPADKVSHEQGRLALQQRKKFEVEYFNLKALAEGIIDRVKAQLPDAVEKFKKLKKTFPILAFHASKYGNAQLIDSTNIADHSALLKQFRYNAMAQLPTLMEKTENEFNPSTKSGRLGIVWY